MRLLIKIALILFFAIGYSPHLTIAETPSENRTVSESINGKEPIEKIVDDSHDEEVFAQKSTFLVFTQLIGALAFVVFLIYFLLRFITKRSQSYRSTQLLQNIGGVQLGANRSVQLVKVGERLLVVGVGETIQLLKEIDNQDEIDRLLIQQEEQFARFEQPMTKLTHFMKNRGNRKKDVQPSPSNSDAFKDLFAKQLEDVSNTQDKLRDEVRERDK